MSTCTPEQIARILEIMDLTGARFVTANKAVHPGRKDTLWFPDRIQGFPWHRNYIELWIEMARLVGDDGFDAEQRTRSSLQIRLDHNPELARFFRNLNDMMS